MSGLGFAPVILGGAGGYLLYRALVEDGEAPPPPPHRGGGNVIEDRAKSWKARNTVGGAVAMVPGMAAGAVFSPRPPTNGSPPVQGIVGDQEQINRAEREALNQFKAKCADEYGKLTEDAKIAGATWVNHQIPAGLTGHESWDEAQAKIGAAIGAMAGRVACNAIPIPGVNAVLAATACATIGAMIGGYLAEKLGPKIKEWATKAWTETKAWLEDKWEDVEDAASDAVDWLDENIW